MLVFQLIFGLRLVLLHGEFCREFLFEVTTLALEIFKRNFFAAKTFAFSCLDVAQKCLKKKRFFAEKMLFQKNQKNAFQILNVCQVFLCNIRT
jgi:hypothetical protein